MKSLPVLLLLLQSALSFAQDKTLPPAAILPFAERGASLRGYGAKVSDILFAELSTNPDIILVDREDLEKQMKEQELGASGMVRADQSAKLGQLTGAKVLITGSVIEADKELYLVARLVSTETGRTFGAKVNGSMEGELGPMARKLAEEVAGVLRENAGDLVAKPIVAVDVIATLREKLGDKPRPTVYISVAEQHIGRTVIDPAVETELSHICRELGYTVLDAKEGDPQKADIRLIGEGFSEFAMRQGNFVSVKARVELKALDAKGEVLSYERQTTLVVDIAENVAGKSALQSAASAIALRILPALAK